uniref:Uncharacterized protein n=1 Tax=Cacopsylla melanoneura TaxID=428564 RepID=A0A8D8XR92_9HEMI
MDKLFTKIVNSTHSMLIEYNEYLNEAEPFTKELQTSLRELDKCIEDYTGKYRTNFYNVSNMGFKVINNYNSVFDKIVRWNSSTNELVSLILENNRTTMYESLYLMMNITQKGLQAKNELKYILEATGADLSIMSNILNPMKKNLKVEIDNLKMQNTNNNTNTNNNNNAVNSEELGGSVQEKEENSKQHENRHRDKAVNSEELLFL